MLLAACGGGGSKSSSPTTTGGGSGDVTTTSSGSSGSGGNGSCFTKPGSQKAKVRFVNLFTDSTYPGGSIDVWQGFGASDPCGKKLATVPFGTATDYLDVTASDESGNWSAVSYVSGSTADDHKIIDQSETWKGGEQVTMLVMGQDPTSGNGPSSGSDETFYESASDINHTLDVVPGKALVAIGAMAIQYIVKGGVWDAGLVGGSKCLPAVGDDATTKNNIGGTTLLPYDIAPASLNVGLYKSDPGTCTGTPDIGPATIDGTAGSRTMVLAYGVDAQHVKLLVLPIKT